VWLAAAALGVAIVAGGAAWLALFPHVPHDLGGAADLDPIARRVRIPVADGDAVDGWYVPGTRRAVVLVLHGYGRNHTRSWRYGGFMNRAGYGVVTIDFRSSRPRASGRRLPTTLGHHELPDARAALAWIRSEPELLGHTVAVMGESLGGAVALMLAAESPDVAAVVVDGAFASGRHALEDSSEGCARVPRWPGAPLARGIGRMFTGKDPGTPDAVAAASELRARPIYFIHGLADNRISPRQVELLWRAAGGKDPLWIVPGVGHNHAWKRYPDEYARRVLAFLDQHAGRAGWQTDAPHTAGASVHIVLHADPFAASARSAHSTPPPSRDDRSPGSGPAVPRERA
jgi:pimeloyl-ACP methyl ester carboxylesterase